jgi:hypothetical protein
VVGGDMRGEVKTMVREEGAGGGEVECD